METYGSEKASLAARLGSWSVAHRRTAILAWVGLFVIALVVSVGDKHLSTAGEANGDSAKAERVLESGGFNRPAVEQVLIQAPSQSSIRTPAARRAASDIIAAVERTGRVRNIRSPFSTGNEGQLSADGRSALVLFAMKGKRDTADKRVEPVVRAVKRVAAAHPGLRIEQFGDASATKALDDTVGKDFKRAESSSIPLTFVILWIAFAGVVAALLPLMLSLTAIMIAAFLISITSHAVPIDGSANSLGLLIGLAVGVDYSLFYYRRSREERARGASVQDAVRTAAATSGKAVLTSGLTVITAMSAMFITGQGTFMGMAEVAAIVVAVAMVGSLTVLPALLSSLGDRVERGRIPFLGRTLQRRRSSGESRFWSAVVRPAQAHPVATILATTTILGLLAFPVLRLQTAVPGLTDIPKNLAVMKTYDRVQRAFPGGPLPATVVVSAPNVESPGVRSAILSFKRKVLASEQAHQPITVDVNEQRTVARLAVPISGDGVNKASQEAVQTLRSIAGATFGSDASAHVTGSAAISLDFNNQLHARQFLVIAFVLGLAFVLLLWSFRSIVIPTTAILLNLLSVAAAYGVLVSVFQGGSGLIHVPGVHHGPIAAWLPLFLFVILFGLSMDYHVFILSRIREGYDQGLGTQEAVRRGITHSAGVITGAAIVMVAVFSTFATLSVVSEQQLGVGLAVAIFIDATIVRGLLVPAVMSLLGERNWYLPRWLDRLLPRQEDEARDAVQTTPVLGEAG